MQKIKRLGEEAGARRQAALALLFENRLCGSERGRQRNLQAKDGVLPDSSY